MNCVLELARIGYKYGIEPPSLISMEREIEKEDKVVEPPPPFDPKPVETVEEKREKPVVVKEKPAEVKDKDKAVGNLDREVSDFVNFLRSLQLNVLVCICCRYTNKGIWMFRNVCLTQGRVSYFI